MPHEYVFRGEGEPYTPNPDDAQAREAAKREAEKLVNEEPDALKRKLEVDAEIEERIGDYQVGGLDSFGASPTPSDPKSH
jgi:hypothetical protein